MHFASKKVFAKSASVRRAPSPASAPSPHFSPAPPVLPNTNVVSIDLGELETKVALLAGDAESCSDCGAIFNSLSKTKLGRGGETTWQCEFCDHENPLELEDEERPSADICDYVLSPALEAKVSNEAPTLIFVIDTSGSMCVTTELQGNIKLRGNNSQAVASTLNEGKIHDQFLPGQRRDITYVSRLQCVQAAIENQLESLQKQHPKAKVGLVCFNNEVIIIGDGTQNPIIVTGDKLYDYENLLQAGTQHPLTRDIESSKNHLVDKLFKLEEAGSTALGPAVTVAVGMCLNNPGSKIVLATDGIANTGVGTLDSHDLSSTDFYTRLATHAKEKAITISVIGIRGDNVGMAAIGKLAEITQGDIDLVDPVNITKNFASILEAKLVATNVEVKLFLHKGFKFPADPNWVTKEDGGKTNLFASRNVGNAFKDSEITAQFSQKDDFELSKLLSSEEGAEQKTLPFQVQITYSNLSGMKCLRVITKSKELTRDFEEVEKDLDVGVLGMHANDLTAQLANQGNFEEAMNQQMAYGQLLEKKIATPSERAAFGAWAQGQQQVFQAQPQFNQPQFQFGPSPLPSRGMVPPPGNRGTALSRASAGPTMRMPSGGPTSTSLGRNPYSAPMPSSPSMMSFSSVQPQQQYSQQPQPFMQPQQSQQPQDDETSNAIFNQMNCRKNKQQWGGERKY